MSNEIMNASNSDYICTVDTNSAAGAIAIFNAISSAKSLASIGDEIFTVVDIVTRPSVRSITNEPCTSTYFICDDGNIYFTQSDGINRSINMFMELFKNSGLDIHSGIDMQVVSNKTSKGNTIKSIRIVPKK